METLDSSRFKFTFSNINPFKLSFSFTWDDNFDRHIKYIAPIFDKYDKKCTFYINPGELYFKDSLLSGYTLLARRGFEIGSHGYTHQYFSKLSQENYLLQLTKSQKEINDLLGIRPITFAFPHHDFTPKMLSLAKKVYFETRNTLNNSPRFSLKSYTTFEEIQDVVKMTISEDHSIVFSGHSIKLDIDNDIIDGYEPLPIGILDNTIKTIIQYSNSVEICTFVQAALKEYICANCEYTNKIFYLTSEQIVFLNTFGLTKKTIGELV